jgi:signal transduction histidine kinase
LREERRRKPRTERSDKAVVRLLERERHAREAAERRLAADAALRDAVTAISRADNWNEFIHMFGASAAAATGADSAFVEAVDERTGDVVVRASAGAHAPPLDARFGYEGSCVEAISRTSGPILVADGSLSEHGHFQESESCAGSCEVLLLPLQVGGNPSPAALCLLRSPQKPAFLREEIDRAAIFGELAVLAMNRLRMLEEARQRRDELERVSASRTRLMRGFSHDIKNPLGAADMFAALLQDGTYGQMPEAQLTVVGRMRRSIHTALALLEDLVELSRAESGHLELHRAPLDLRTLVGEAAEDYRASVEAAGLALTVEMPDDECRVESDGTRLRQILGNLLSNAVKYTPRGGIHVRLHAHQGRRSAETVRWFGVDVRDTGPGIPEEKREQIFQEFTRLQPGAAQGVGLGLAISRRIARLLGGDIAVEDAPGGGSVFTLWIPERAPEAAADD